MPERRKTFLLCGMAPAIFAVSVVATGESVAGEDPGVASLFLYAASTGALVGLVFLMPPYRSANKISGRGSA